jgi:hypothetical protein
MSNLLLRAACALVTAGAATAPALAQDVMVVPDTAAARYVGQRVTVEGLVATVKVSAHRHTTYLNFRFPYPDHSFSAWIADTLASRFPAPAELERRRVRVTGVVWMQDGKWPAVTLERPEDLVIVPDPGR